MTLDAPETMQLVMADADAEPSIKRTRSADEVVLVPLPRLRSVLILR